MGDEIREAKSLVAPVRYSGDKPISITPGQLPAMARLKGAFFQHGLEITSHVAPSLAGRVAEACNRLRVPKTSVSAFIFSSPEIQGQCFVGEGDQCILRFSSGLIDLLEEQEFEFVVGHEIGHFLYQHEALQANSKETPEYFLARRAQEISVDRVGLIACQSLDVALRALMKTASGLTGKHLRFDTGSYISQLQKIDPKSSDDMYLNTHPSILIRSRALLWFSLSSGYTLKESSVVGPELLKMDARIELDLRRFVDGAIRRQIEVAKLDVYMWRLAFEAVQAGRYQEPAQKIFETEFGQDTAAKLQTFIANAESGSLEDDLFQKVQESRGILEALLPSQFLAEMKSIEQRVSLSLDAISA